MSRDTSRTRIAAWLADHPRMIGALFTLLVLLSQSAAVAATASQSTNGP